MLDGNPLHREQLDIVDMLGKVLAVNTVIDEERRLAFVNYGEVVASHLGAVDFVRSFAQVPVERRFKTIVTSAAGYPLDKTYYQTVKGMVSPMDILEPGGNLLIASECSEGMGSQEYVEAQRRLLALGADGFYEDISRKTHADIDEWQTQMQLRPMRIGALHLYSHALRGADRALTGVNLVESLADAVKQCADAARDPHVAVIPEGPYVVPVFRAAAAAGA